MNSGIHDPRHAFSEWFHKELVAEYAKETEQWATDRVTRVQERLNNTRRGLKPLDCTILWLASPVAFTMYGSHVYFSRRLLERMPSDENVAFVLAHEAAHHDLGHLDLFAGWTGWMPQSLATVYLATLVHILERKTYGPERENDADDYAVRLCAKAGYDVIESVDALQILQNIALDHGDVSGVYGPENLLDPTDPNVNSTPYRLQEWLWTRVSGYEPLHKRIERARALARTLAGKVEPRESRVSSHSSSKHSTSEAGSARLDSSASSTPRNENTHNRSTNPSAPKETPAQSEPSIAHVVNDASSATGASSDTSARDRVVHTPSGTWHCNRVQWSNRVFVLTDPDEPRNRMLAMCKQSLSEMTDEEIAASANDPTVRYWVDATGHEWRLAPEDNPTVAYCTSAHSSRDQKPLDVVWLHPPNIDVPKVLPWSGLGALTHQQLLAWMATANSPIRFPR